MAGPRVPRPAYSAAAAVRATATPAVAIGPGRKVGPTVDGRDHPGAAGAATGQPVHVHPGRADEGGGAGEADGATGPRSRARPGGSGESDLGGGEQPVVVGVLGEVLRRERMEAVPLSGRRPARRARSAAAGGGSSRRRRASTSASRRRASTASSSARHSSTRSSCPSTNVGLPSRWGRKAAAVVVTWTRSSRAVW